MKKGSIKNNTINAEVLRALTQIISYEVKDPDVDPLATVTKVEVTPDLQYCKVHISSLASDEELEKTVDGLTRAKGFIRYQLAHSVNLRKTPELTFVPDRSMKYAIEMSKKIDELIAENEKACAGESDEAEDEEEV